GSPSPRTATAPWCSAVARTSAARSPDPAASARPAPTTARSAAPTSAPEPAQQGPRHEFAGAVAQVAVGLRGEVGAEQRRPALDDGPLRRDVSGERPVVQAAQDDDDERVRPALGLPRLRV